VQSSAIQYNPELGQTIYGTDVYPYPVQQNFQQIAEEKKAQEEPKKEDKRPKLLTGLEKTQAELKKWQKEQEKLEKVNKELGRIDKSLVIMAETPKERKWVSLESNAFLLVILY
jgi:hypothetical protein